MRTSQSVKTGGWILISLNILMALGSIWVFMRMTPAIDRIIQQNERSLQACEEMLSVLILINNTGSDSTKLKISFINAFERAFNNITEIGEKEELQTIKKYHEGALKGNESAINKTVESLNDLSNINREAMIRADAEARQIGNAGAWGVVFMSSVVFIVGLIFLKILHKNLVSPIEEINSVLNSSKKGDKMRRCSGHELPQEIISIYREINELIDNKHLR